MTDYVYRGRGIVGTLDNGNPKSIGSTEEGHLEVAIHSPISPFGSLHTENLLPIFQTDAVYGLNSSETATTTGLAYDPGPAIGSNSGTNTGTNNLFTSSTGTTAYSFATIQSRKRLRYRAGQGLVGRFAGFFSTPAANTVVVGGFGTAEAGVYFGYNGTSFGILHSTGGKREVRTFTVSAATSTGGTVTFRLNGLDTQVNLATSATTTLTANDIATKTFPGWKVQAIGSTVIFLADSVGAKAGTFSITLNTAIGTAGSFATTLTGVASTDTWVAQSSWNGDKCDGTGSSGFTINPQKGNVYQVGVQYLGFGTLTFSIEIPSINGNNAIFIVVHTINAPNTRETVTILQPSFPYTQAAYSSGSTTNVSISVGSFAGFIEGQKKLTGPRQTYFNTTAVASSTSIYTPIFTVRNGYYYGGRANQAVVNLLSFGGAATSNTGITSFYLIRNGTLTGGSWAAWSTTSCTDVNSTATEVTFSSNDQVVFTGTVAKDGNILFAFGDDVTLQPGETFTLAIRSVTATANCVGQLNTREDQ
jgi:hypothetical protein